MQKYHFLGKIGCFKNNLFFMEICLVYEVIGISGLFAAEAEEPVQEAIEMGMCILNMQLNAEMGLCGAVNCPNRPKI